MLSSKIIIIESKLNKDLRSNAFWNTLLLTPLSIITIIFVIHNYNSKMYFKSLMLIGVFFFALFLVIEILVYFFTPAKTVISVLNNTLCIINYYFNKKSNFVNFINIDLIQKIVFIKSRASWYYSLLSFKDSAKNSYQYNISISTNNESYHLFSEISTPNARNIALQISELLRINIYCNDESMF